MSNKSRKNTKFGKQKLSPADSLPSIIRPTNTVPEELRKLDNQPLAALTPERNEVDTTGDTLTGGIDQTSNELSLHSDGTLLKYAPSSRPPAVILVDGTGRQVGIICNSEIAELVCNGVNALNLAAVQLRIKGEKDSDA